MTEERYISLLSHVSSILRLKDIAVKRLDSILSDMQKWQSMADNPNYAAHENVRKGRISDILLDLRSEELQTRLDIEAFDDMLGLAEEKLKEYNGTAKSSSFPKSSVKVCS